MNPGADHPEPNGTLELRLLGHAEVRLEGRVLELGERKTLALLAFLALEGEVGRPKLLSVFWEDFDEGIARRNLRRELHRLREAGLRDHLEAHSDRLRLGRLLPTDVRHFEAAAARGDLEKALEVYRGELLEGVRVEPMPRFEAWLEGWRGRLAEQRKRAQLELAGRLEARGDWRRALALRQAVLQSDALQEEQHREVMRLQHQLGQREAALRQFELCKTILEEELGLEPLPATVQLAQQIRAAEPAAPLEPSRSAQVPRASAWVPPFVGRQDALADLAASDAPLTLVTGEAGVGKTRLIEEAAPDALRVRFRQISSQTPLYAVAESLREALNDPDERARFDALETIWRLEAARLLPELSPEAPPRPAQERAVFLEGLARALSCCATDVIVFEDLHWADQSSLELLAHLLRRPQRARQMRFLVTARADELPREARSLLEAWRQTGLVFDLPLGPLSPADVGRLVADVLGDGGAFAQALFAATAGNSFYVCETLRHTLDQHGLGGDAASVGVAPSVRAAVLQRAERLGSAAHRLLEAAALTEDGFRLEDIQPATALSEWEALDALERAQGAHLLRALETGYGFAHDLTRQALQSTLGTERRRLIHSYLAQSLERTDAAPARIAAHLEGAGKPARAVAWRVRAAEAAERVYAHDQALEQYQKAIDNGADTATAFFCHNEKLKILQILDQPEPMPQTIQAMQDKAVESGNTEFIHTAALANINYQSNSGHYARAVELATELLEQATLSAEHRTKAGYYLGVALHRQGKLQEADARLQEAFEQNENDPASTKILLTRCHIAVRIGHSEDAHKYAQQALDRFTAFKNPLGQTEALLALGNVAIARDNLNQAIEYYTRGVGIAEKTKNLNFLRPLLVNIFLTHIRLKELRASEIYLEKINALPTESLDPQSKFHLHYCIAHHAQLSGELGTAFLHCDTQVHLADQTENPAAKIRSRLSKAHILKYCGAFQSALETIKQAWSISQEHKVQEYYIEVLLEQLHCEIRLFKQVDLSVLEQHLAENQNPEDELLAHIAKAQYFLHQNNPTAAKQQIENKQPWRQMELAFLSLELKIATQSGTPNEGLLAQAQNLPPLTPYEALEFQKIYADALEGNGQPEEAQKLRIKTKKLVLQMADSLEAYPDLQRVFLELHADLTKAL